VSALTARNVALTDQILATLADEGCLPISTMGLLEKLRPLPPAIAERLAAFRSGRPLLHSELLRLLNRLAERGEIEKITVPGMRCRYWRLPMPAVASTP
jgi:hypothetical protein